MEPTSEQLAVFNLLRQACWDKPTVNFNDLPLGEYPVIEFILVQTRYGKTLKVDLGDKFIYLPIRFGVNMTEEKVDILNTLPQTLVYAGRDSTRNNL